jgi:hypothetical protein
LLQARCMALLQLLFALHKLPLPRSAAVTFC